MAVLCVRGTQSRPDYIHNQNAMIKCIIFDCDGTLVDREYLCNIFLKIKLKDYGCSGSVLVYVMEAKDFERGAKAYANSTLRLIESIVR